MFYKTSKIQTSEVTPDLITQWKRKYASGVFEITVEDKKAFVRQLTTNEVKATIKLVKKMEPLQVALYYLKKMWLAGDDEIINDDTYQISVLDQLGDIIKPKIHRVMPGLAHYMK